MTSDILPTDHQHYYIGEHDCKVATCPLKQEFPEADDPYCIRHSLAEYFASQ